MKVPGLGTASLPAFLAPAPTSTTAEIDEEIPQKVVVPKNKARRYNEAMAICKQIINIAQEDDEVFRTIIPQLQHLDAGEYTPLLDWAVVCLTPFHSIE